MFGVVKRTPRILFTQIDNSLFALVDAEGASARDLCMWFVSLSIRQSALISKHMLFMYVHSVVRYYLSIETMRLSIFPLSLSRLNAPTFVSYFHPDKIPHNHVLVLSTQRCTNETTATPTKAKKESQKKVNNTPNKPITNSMKAFSK